MSRKKERVTEGRRPKKYVQPTTEGRCPYCHVAVKALESHIRAKHKGKKLPKKRK